MVKTLICIINLTVYLCLCSCPYSFSFTFLRFHLPTIFFGYCQSNVFYLFSQKPNNEHDNTLEQDFSYKSLFLHIATTVRYALSRHFSFYVLTVEGCSEHGLSHKLLSPHNSTLIQYLASLNLYLWITMGAEADLLRMHFRARCHFARMPLCKKNIFRTMLLQLSIV